MNFALILDMIEDGIWKPAYLDFNTIVINFHPIM